MFVAFIQIPILFGAVFAALWLLAPYFVYKDANTINARMGARAVSSSVWSILSLLIFYIAIPLYVFVPRRKALSKMVQMRESLFETSNLATGAERPKPSYGVFLLIFLGLVMLFYGINTAIHPPNLANFSPGTAYLQPYASQVGFDEIATSSVIIAVGVFLYLRYHKKLTEFKKRNGNSVGNQFQ